MRARVLDYVLFALCCALIWLTLALHRARVVNARLLKLLSMTASLLRERLQQP